MSDDNGAQAPEPLLQVIRKKCRWCCCDQLAEIRDCRIDSCPLHPYRMGTNPFSRRKGNPQSLPNRSLGSGDFPRSPVGHPDSIKSRLVEKLSPEAEKFGATAIENDRPRRPITQSRRKRGGGRSLD
jgi:hypothetical protein